MTTSLSILRATETHFTRNLDQLGKRGDVARETRYYLSRIETVKSPADLVGDSRLLRFVARAFGMDEVSNAKALLRRVLEEGVASRTSLANRMADRRFFDFASTFNFARYGATAMTFDRTRQGVVDRYLRTTMEETVGQSSKAVQLALYFERKIPQVTSAYGILADRALLKVATTALQLPDSFSSLSIDRQAQVLKDRLPLTQFTQPDGTSRFLERFVSLWDLSHTPHQASASPLLSGNGGVAIDETLLSTIQTLSRGQ